MVSINFSKFLRNNNSNSSYIWKLAGQEVDTSSKKMGRTKPLPDLQTPYSTAQSDGITADVLNRYFILVDSRLASKLDNVTYYQQNTLPISDTSKRFQFHFTGTANVAKVTQRLHLYKKDLSKIISWLD